jgi:hypothetical protein
LRAGGVASPDQALAEAFDVQHLAHREVERVGVDVRLWCESLQQRFEIDDDDASLESRQAREHAQALRHDVGMRREQVVRQCFPIRKAFDVQAGLAEELQLILEAVRLARIGGDDEHGPRGPASGFGQP